MYDLAWYLSDPGWPAPNLALLAAALRQGAEPSFDELRLSPGDWRDAVATRLSRVSWERLSADVRPFLEGRERLPARAELLELLRVSPT